MEIVSTMTFELDKRSVPENNSTKSSTPTSPTLDSVDGSKKLVVMEHQPAEAAPAVEENRSPVDESRSPAHQERTDSTVNLMSEPNPSVVTADSFNKVDLLKIHSALSLLTSAVQEEELHYFMQLEASESMNAKLKQNFESTAELRQKNDKLKDGLETAQAMLDNMRAEAACQVEALNESLVSKDVELANLQADYNILKEKKEAELAGLRHSIETMAGELMRLETAYRGSTQSLNERENELAALRGEYETLQRSFAAVKAEKDDIEQGHEEAKEKWKRLVITMKSEYDNFRASFEHLKVTKREMEETHRVEKEALENELGVLRAENGNMSAALASLKTCKEVIESGYQEAKAAWEVSKEALETQTEHLRSELEILQEAKAALEAKLHDAEARFNANLQSIVEPLEKTLAVTEQELSVLKQDHCNLQMNKKAVEDEKHTLYIDKEELTKECDRLKEELNKDREDLAALKEQHETVTANYASKVSECVALTSEIESMKSTKKELEQVFFAIQADYMAQKEDYERLKPMENELEKCTADLEELKSKLAALEQDKAELEKDLAEMKEQLETQSANSHVLQVTLDGTRSRHAEEKAKLEKKLQKVSRAVDTKAEALNMALTKYMKELKAKEKLEKDIVTMRSELIESKDEELKMALAKLNDKMEASLKHERMQRENALQAQVAAENQLASFEKVVAKTKAELLAERCQGDSLRESLEKAEAGRREATTQVDEMTKSLEELTMKCDFLTQEGEKLKAEVTVAEECKKYMKEDTAQLKAQINALSQSVAKKIATIATLEAKLEEAKVLQQTVDSQNKELHTVKSRCESLQNTIKSQEFLQQMIDSQNKELDMIKSRCESLQTTVDETEEELEKKVKSNQEANILLEKKSTELQTLQERCQMLQASLKKAEALYMDGIEQIKTQTERKQKAALEDALDRVYVLSQMLTKKEEEVMLLQNRLTQGRGEVDADTNAQSETKQALANKINFLDNMVNNKDDEILLLKARCADLQALLEKADNSNEKASSSHSFLYEDLVEAQEKLQALNNEIAAKHLMLKAVQTGDEGEFEIIFDNKNNNVQEMKAELESLRARCKEIEECAKIGGTEHWIMRCKDLEEAMTTLTKQYEEECARRKEAEQVFSNIDQKPSNESKKDKKQPLKSIFGRVKPIPEQTDNSVTKVVGNRWPSLRGRRQKEEMIVRTYTVESTGRDEWRSQYSYAGSPRHHRAQDAPVRGARSPRSIGGDGIFSQIPHHIQSNFNEVGVYKQRLSNTYLPVLCLGPNDIPPGPARDDWVSKIGKSKVHNIGVYYYGKDGNDKEAYAIVPWFAFIPYSKAVQRGLDKLPRVVLDKIQRGEQLTAEEKQIYDGMEAMIEAAGKSKEERTHPLQHLTVPNCIVTMLPKSEDDVVSEMGV